MSATTGAKIGRGWSKSARASAHDVAVASAACANQRQFARSRSATVRGRDRSAASSSRASLRARTRAAPSSRRCVTRTTPRNLRGPRAASRRAAGAPARAASALTDVPSFARVIVDAEVAEALRARRGVVALESTLIAHGLPAPRNLHVAREAEAAVRAAGAVPATIALVGGAVRIGLDDAALAAVALRDGVIKAGVRDVAPAGARGVDAGAAGAATAGVPPPGGVRGFLGRGPGG